jgi:hypothetical protein
MNAFTQLLGGMSQIWPNVTFIACVFVVLIFRPERIARPSLFWLGCLLFTLSLIAPTTGIFIPTEATSIAGAMRGESIPLVLKLVNASSLLLFSGAFLATVSSIMPTGMSNRSDATGDGLR